MLKVAGFDYLDIADTDGIALAVYFQGCHFHCKGCHNPELQPFQGGTEYDVLDLVDKVISDYEGGNYDYIVLLGGEPLDQDRDFLRLFVRKLTEAGIKVWMYTGYDYSHVPDWCKHYFYCIKAGRYDISFVKDGKLATGNQAYYFKDGRIEK